MNDELNQIVDLKREKIVKPVLKNENVKWLLNI